VTSLQDKTSEKILVLFLLAVVVSVCAVGYTLYGSFYNTSNWTTHNITGRITYMQLYNQFPTVELYIVLDTGNYTRVTVNPFWTYAQLVNYNLNDTVILTYQQNSAGDVQVTHIEVKEWI